MSNLREPWAPYAAQVPFTITSIRVLISSKTSAEAGGTRARPRRNMDDTSHAAAKQCGLQSKRAA